MDAGDVRLGRYKHFKGEEYIVIGVARHSETLEKLVVYQGQYNSEKFGDKPIWVRPVNEFLSKKIVDGELVDRFVYLGEK
jgi:hypothetical protein